jgi:cell division protein FtsL
MLNSKARSQSERWKEFQKQHKNMRSENKQRKKKKANQLMSIEFEHKCSTVIIIIMIIIQFILGVMAENTDLLQTNTKILKL